MQVIWEALLAYMAHMTYYKDFIIKRHVTCLEHLQTTKMSIIKLLHKFKGSSKELNVFAHDDEPDSNDEEDKVNWRRSNYGFFKAYLRTCEEECSDPITCSVTGKIQ